MFTYFCCCWVDLSAKYYAIYNFLFLELCVTIFKSTQQSIPFLDINQQFAVYEMRVHCDMVRWFWMLLRVVWVPSLLFAHCIRCGTLNSIWFISFVFIRFQSILYLHMRMKVHKRVPFTPYFCVSFCCVCDAVVVVVAKTNRTSIMQSAKSRPTSSTVCQNVKATPCAAEHHQHYQTVVGRGRWSVITVSTSYIYITYMQFDCPFGRLYTTLYTQTQETTPQREMVRRTKQTKTV